MRKLLASPHLHVLPVLPFSSCLQVIINHLRLEIDANVKGVQTWAFEASYVQLKNKVRHSSADATLCLIDQVNLNMTTAIDFLPVNTRHHTLHLLICHVAVCSVLQGYQKFFFY